MLVRRHITQERGDAACHDAERVGLVVGILATSGNSLHFIAEGCCDGFAYVLAGFSTMQHRRASQTPLLTRPHIYGDRARARHLHNSARRISHHHGCALQCRQIAQGSQRRHCKHAPGARGSIILNHGYKPVGARVVVGICKQYAQSGMLVERFEKNAETFFRVAVGKRGRMISDHLRARAERGS